MRRAVTAARAVTGVIRDVARRVTTRPQTEFVISGVSPPEYIEPDETLLDFKDDHSSADTNPPIFYFSHNYSSHKGISRGSDALIRLTHVQFDNETEKGHILKVFDDNLIKFLLKTEKGNAELYKKYLSGITTIYLNGTDLKDKRIIDLLLLALKTSNNIDAIILKNILLTQGIIKKIFPNYLLPNIKILIIDRLLDQSKPIIEDLLVIILTMNNIEFLNLSGFVFDDKYTLRYKYNLSESVSFSQVFYIILFELKHLVIFNFTNNNINAYEYNNIFKVKRMRFVPKNEHSRSSDALKDTSRDPYEFNINIGNSIVIKQLIRSGVRKINFNCSGNFLNRSKNNVTDALDKFISEIDAEVLKDRKTILQHKSGGRKTKAKSPNKLKK